MSHSEMNANGPAVTLHMVASIDGFIARQDNDVSWLDSPGNVYEAGVSEDDAQDVTKSIGCYVFGSRTYEHALQLGWPYGDTPTAVLTMREFPCASKSVHFCSGDLRRLVEEVLLPRYGNIWVVGGATVCQNFLRLGLVDEIRLMIAPVVLGGGLRLFADSAAEERWRLKNTVAYTTGFVELSYERASTNPQP